MVKTKMVRLNTSVSTTMNDWLNQQSDETGLSKSALVLLALENFHQQKEAMKTISNIGPIMEKLEEIERRIKS